MLAIKFKVACHHCCCVSFHVMTLVMCFDVYSRCSVVLMAYELSIESTAYCFMYDLQQVLTVLRMITAIGIIYGYLDSTKLLYE